LRRIGAARGAGTAPGPCATTLFRPSLRHQLPLPWPATTVPGSRSSALLARVPPTPTVRCRLVRLAVQGHPSAARDGSSRTSCARSCTCVRVAAHAHPDRPWRPKARSPRVAGRRQAGVRQQLLVHVLRTRQVAEERQRQVPALRSTRPPGQARPEVGDRLGRRPQRDEQPHSRPSCRTCTCGAGGPGAPRAAATAAASSRPPRRRRTER
jgi:hypothetical protein